MPRQTHPAAVHRQTFTARGKAGPVNRPFMTNEKQSFDPEELLILIARLAARKWLQAQQEKYLLESDATGKTQAPSKLPASKTTP